MTAPSVAGKRRFEFVDGSSDKFWEIQIAGRELTIRFGRNGANGQTNIKTYPNETTAQASAEKLVAEKVGKGYVEVK